MKILPHNLLKIIKIDEKSMKTIDGLAGLLGWLAGWAPGLLAAG